MTVSELIDTLRYYDPTTLVTIDTLGFSRGVFPISDHVDMTEGITIEGEHYDCVVLEPSLWTSEKE
jgi:hypothetical protein